jgi:ABC-2 type transport system ATP-binding protein
MPNAFELISVTRRFGETRALDDVTLAVPTGHVVGLIGRNGGGKTTLLRHVVGLQLATTGECRTLGRPTRDLGGAELSRIGFVPQEHRLLHWMTVWQHLDYVASFYENWDDALRKRLQRELELETDARVGTLSPGNVQKLAILIAVCHRPDLLLLDEPVSALDPIARGQLLTFFLELLREERRTIVVSSHVLRDVEEIVDRVICLEKGRVVEDAAMDDLQERYAEWVVSSANGGLPDRFDEPFVVRQEIVGRQARLLVRDAAAHLEAFRGRHHAEVTVRPLNLERIFPLLVEGGAR